MPFWLAGAVGGPQGGHTIEDGAAPGTRPVEDPLNSWVLFGNSAPSDSLSTVGLKPHPEA